MGFYKSFKEFQEYYANKFQRNNPLPWQDGMQALIWWITENLPENTQATVEISGAPTGVSISGKGVDGDPYIFAFNFNENEVKGPKGDTGAKGPQGETGPQGPAGQDGTIVVANPTEAGSIDLTKLKIGDTVYNIPLSDVDNSIMHANIWRGKNLGTRVTAEQLNTIQDGIFKDLFIGDYWVINGTTWRIADMDYFYQVGDMDRAFTKHHLVMIPDEILYMGVMNDSATTEGGYVGSKMYTTGLIQAKTAINSSFGILVQTHRENLIDVTENGRPTHSNWYNCTVELMNEIMVYGCFIRGAMGTGELMARNYTTAKKQLSMFRLNPKMLNKRQNVWLRDINSSETFASVGSYGEASAGLANIPYGVRPYFVIG